ncbi:MAG TPA: metallophosphoesterase [Chloroflexota bacterium]|nr:metallophosphoesterase [Chloroflexota bacterium]
MGVKLVVTADNHLGRYHARMPVARLDERRRWLRRAFRKSVDHAIDQRADFFLQCGDLFDSVDPRNSERLFVADCLSDLKAAGVTALAVGGNHDTPRQSTEHGGYLAADLYARLGGLRLFVDSHEITSETFERDGLRLAIGGLCWDARLSFGQDPLAGKPFPDPPEGRPDWKILLTHASLEGHTFPGSFEPVIARESIAQLDAELLLVGHVHARTHVEVGGTHVLVPGATERMYYDEFGHDPGFLFIELHAGAKFTHRWVTHPAQPRCRITVTGHEITPQPHGLRPPDETSTDVLVRRVREQADPDCLTTLQLEGRIPREVYAELDLARVQEVGAESCFFFDVDTTQLEPENELGEASSRGIRLSQVEELQETAAQLREAAVTDAERRLVELGLQEALAHYQHTAGA